MAYYNYDRRPEVPPGHTLRHAVSDISDISESDGPYDAATGSHRLRGRESLISIDSQFNGRISPPSAATGTWSNPFAGSNAFRGGGGGGGGGYSPVSVTGGPPTRSITTRSHRAGYLPTMQTMAEGEEAEMYDMSSLQKATPVHRASGRYEAIRERRYPEEDGDNGVPEFDFTVSLGPMSAHDAEFIRKLQEQEAKGRLTGGLGQGFRAEDKLRGADLLPLAGGPQRTSSMSFTRRMSNRRPSRAETIRHMGQDAANRRGQVIEVIMEDEQAEADLSHLEGPDILAGDPNRARLNAKERVTQVFYPQPNWKPFAMKGPYLTVLVVMSLGLGVLQEVLLRHYMEDPIIAFKSPDDIDPGSYFAVKFAPTLSAVVYGVLWQFTDFDVRRLEAFYQLSKKGGASAAESLNLDYATGLDFLRPFRAFRRGHYAVLFSSVATILAVSLVPTFAAASVVLTPNRAARLANPDGRKSLNFSPLFSRLLTTTLVIIAVLGIGLFYLLQSRRSGLLSDVRGIGGLASMAVVSHILMDFRDMDTARHDDIHHRLKYKRYVLRNSSLAPDDDEPTTTKPPLTPTPAAMEDHDLSTNPHPLMLRKAGLISMIVGLVLFTGFIPAFLFSPAAVVADKAPWVITATAVGLKLAWGGMESSVRMMEPFYILSKRHAPPKTLLLDYTAMPFGWMPIRALLNRHAVVFLVGLGSIMAEFLTILVSGLATVDGHDFLMEYTQGEGGGGRDALHQINSGQETVRSFYVSVILSLFTLLYMSSVATWVLLSRRRAFLPRQPNTISSVLAYMHQSKMLYSFVGTSKMSNAEMLRKLEAEGEAEGGEREGGGEGGRGRTYGLGWFVGRDGQKHCGVDEEELIGDYKHGIDLLQAIQPWSTQWDVL